jgi:hypothetical protein
LEYDRKRKGNNSLSRKGKQENSYNQRDIL